MKALLLSRKKAFVVYLIACLFPVVNQLSTNYVFSILLGTAQSPSFDSFVHAIVISIGIVICTSLMFVLSRFMRIRFMRDTLLDVRIKAFHKIMNQSFEHFNQKSKAIYVSNLINDINVFEQNFFIKLLNIIFRGGTYVVSLIILAVMDWKYAALLMIASVLIFVFSKRFEAKTIAMQENVSAQNETFTVDVTGTLEGMEILKLNAIEKPFLSKTTDNIQRIENSKFRYQVFTEGQRTITRLMAMSVFIISLIYLMQQVQNGMSITQMTFMIMLGNGCIWPLEQVMPMINELKASVKIYDKITKEDSEISVAEEEKEPFVYNKTIRVDHLSYSYGEHMVLKNVNLTLEKGKKYLLKGASGSGKSTLIRLLSKSFSDYSGSISIDGVDFKTIRKSDFYEHVSFIYQDVFLFEDSLYNNISLYKTLDTSRVLKAIEGAGLKSYLDETTFGLEKVLSENGKDLSGGQRQRISIARALVKDVDILFADEATSSLNAELGRAVEKTLLDMDATLIAVSHRFYPGITECYDYVIEIKNGFVTQYSSDEYFKEADVA